MSQIKDRIEIVKGRIQGAASIAGTEPESIRLIAVSKTKPVSMIDEVLQAGLTELGENRVQEAREKHPEVKAEATWHLIGPLQTNKVRHAVHIFDMIQSVDRYALAEELDKRLARLGKKMPVLIQVKTSDEDTKFGVLPEQSISLIEKISSLPTLSIQGLMTIPAYSPAPDEARPAFQLLKNLQSDIKARDIPGVEMKILSMGMSHDFETAIEEGANMVRVGTAIFGPRNSP